MPILRTIEEKEHFSSLDLFKFLLAIMVIAFHTNPFEQCQIPLIDEIAIVLVDVTVPFFFCISGFLLARKWGRKKEERQTKIIKILIDTVKLYVIWTLISFPLSVYGYILSGNSWINCILSYIKYFFFVGKLFQSYHLWYLLAMIYSLVFIFILVHCNRGINSMLLVGVMLYVVRLGLEYFRLNTDAFPMLAPVVGIYEYIFNNGNIFTGMLYMCIGITVVEKRCCFSFFASLVLFITGIVIKYTIHSELGNIIASSCFFMMVLNIDLPQFPFYIILRQLSRYMYLVHLICFSGYTLFIGNFNHLGVDSFVATCVLSLAFAVVVTAIQKRRIRRSTTH